MSIEALVWALTKAPCETPAERLVLVALANHARPDGTAAFPSNARMAAYTCLSERAVRNQLRILEGRGLIWRCDDSIVAAYISRPDRRPRGYNLRLDLVNGGHQIPPDEITGGISRHDGGHLETPRGATGAPEPYMNRTEEPSIESMSEIEFQAQRLTNLFADLVEQNGFSRPAVNKTARGHLERAMRLDGRTAEQLEAAMRWSASHDFWSMNIRSTDKLRKQFERLRAEASRQMRQQTGATRVQGIVEFLQEA